MPAPLELSGLVFGRLTVLRPAGSSPRGSRLWLCVCRCGTERKVLAHHLKSGNTRSCGCAWALGARLVNARKFRDLTGRRFGRLKVVEQAFKRRGRFFWRCVCACGDEKVIDGHSLKSGATKSCGCLHRERASEARRRACAKVLRSGGRFAKSEGDDGSLLRLRAEAA